MERPGLLFARAQPAARGAAGEGSPRRRVPARARRHRSAARCRTLDRGGDRRIRLRHARRNSRWQRQARARAAFRRRRISGRQARGEPPVATRGGATAAARHRSLHPGNDGSGSDAVHARQAPLQRLPARRNLPGTGAGARRGFSGAAPGEAGTHPRHPHAAAGSKRRAAAGESARLRGSGAGYGACPRSTTPRARARIAARTTAAASPRRSRSRRSRMASPTSSCRSSRCCAGSRNSQRPRVRRDRSG